MKREFWAIGNAFAYGIRILNCMFCLHPKTDGWREEDLEMGEDNKWLVAEQINSMCSPMMIDDAYDVLEMIRACPKNRLCERVDCQYHHPQNPTRHNYCHFQDKCDECIENEKSKIDKDSRMHHFESK